MSQRITVMLNDNVVKKLRLRQADLIKKSASTVSFSRVINESLEAALK